MFPELATSRGNATLGAWVAARETVRAKGSGLSPECNRLSSSALAALGLALVCAGAAPATAADLYWDPNGNAAGLGGTGTWNTTNAFWNSSSTGTGGTMSAWNNATLDNAFFNGAAGAMRVTLGSNVTAHNLSFGATPSYTLTGNTITLAGVAPTIDVLGNQTINSLLAGTAGFIKTGAGTLTLTGGNNSPTGNPLRGPIFVNAGTLRAGAYAGSRVFGNNPAVTLANVAGATLDLNNTTQTIGSLAGGGAAGGNVTLGSGRLDVGLDNTSTTYAGVISGTTATTLVKFGTGTLTLTGNNTMAGTVYFYYGTLRAGAADILANARLSGIAGAVFDLNNFDQTVRGLSSGGNVTLGSATLTAGSVGNEIFNGTISGTGGFTKVGSGTQTFSGANTYTGATTINAGTLRAGAAAGGQAFGNLSAVTLANAGSTNLDLNNFNQTIGSLAGGGVAGGNVLLGSATLTTGGNNASTAFAGMISGTGSLVKNGTGTQILSGTNSYTGTTTINAGTLQLGDGRTSGMLGSTGGVAVAGDATLAFNRSNVYTVANTIRGAGTLAQIGTGTTILTGSNLYTGGTTIAAGTLQLGAGGTTGSIQGDADRHRYDASDR